MNERVKERDFLCFSFLCNPFMHHFPLCFPQSLDLVYFNSVTHFNFVFIQIKFEFSLMQFSFIFFSNFFLLLFLFVSFYV
jgi:hypothetical protein